MIINNPTSASGIPTIAPTMVRLTITPASNNTSPTMPTTSRPVKPMIQKINLKSKMNGKKINLIKNSIVGKVYS